MPRAAAASSAASWARRRCSGVSPSRAAARDQVVCVAGQAAAERRSRAHRPDQVRAGAARSRRLPSGRRPGPGTRPCLRRRRLRRRCWAASVRASRIRPSRVPTPRRRDGRGRSPREAAGSARNDVACRRSSPARVSPVAVRWTWLSTKAGATKAPSMSTTVASGNWARPTSSLPSHATTPSRTAIAVRVGHGRAVHPAVQQKSRHLVGFALHGRRFDVDHVDDLAVNVVTARRGVAGSTRDGDQRHAARGQAP